MYGHKLRLIQQMQVAHCGILLTGYRYTSKDCKMLRKHLPDCHAVWIEKDILHHRLQLSLVGHHADEWFLREDIFLQAAFFCGFFTAANPATQHLIERSIHSLRDMQDHVQMVGHDTRSTNADLRIANRNLLNAVPNASPK